MQSCFQFPQTNHKALHPVLISLPCTHWAADTRLPATSHAIQTLSLCALTLGSLAQASTPWLRVCFLGSVIWNTGKNQQQSWVVKEGEQYSGSFYLGKIGKKMTREEKKSLKQLIRRCSYKEKEKLTCSYLWKPVCKTHRECRVNSQAQYQQIRVRQGLFSSWCSQGSTGLDEEKHHGRPPHMARRKLNPLTWLDRSWISPQLSGQPSARYVAHSPSALCYDQHIIRWGPCPP